MKPLSLVLVIFSIIFDSRNAVANELREVNQIEVDFLEGVLAPEPVGDEKFGAYLRRLQFDFLNKSKKGCSVEIRGDLADISLLSEMLGMTAKHVFEEIRKPDEFVDGKNVNLWRLFRFVTSRSQMDFKSVGQWRFVIEGKHEKTPIEE